MKSVHRH